MAKKIMFDESAQRALEINNAVYPIATRTGTLEKRLIDEHDSVRLELTEYERYKVLISLLLGEATFTELFPAGEAESLDKMAQVAYHAQKEFNADIEALEVKKIDEDLNSAGVNKMINTLDRFNKQIDATIQKAELAKTTTKKRKK